MRILHVLNTDRFSGAENVVCQIISMCKSDTVEFFYCSMDGQIRESLNERKIDFVPINKMSVSELKRVIKEVNPDIIHAHDMRATFTASMACGKKPLIAHIHNNAYDSRCLSLKSIAFLLASLKCRHVFWVSDTSYNDYYFKRFIQKKSSRLYNIIDIVSLQQQAAKANDFVAYDVVYLGRLSVEKDPARFIRIMKKVIDHRSDTKIAVIGNGNLENDIQEMARQLNLTNNIDFLGFQEKPYMYLNKAKVMVMTSKWEGIPMSALEAMALGVPIVSTPTDGLTMLIENGKCGFLSNEDNILAGKIELLLSNEELHRTFSNEVLKRAKELNDMIHYREQLIDVYSALLKK